MVHIIKYLWVMVLLGFPITAYSDWSSSNLNVVDRYIVPRYAALQQSSQGLQPAIFTLCQQPSVQHLEQAKQGFHAVMDAWQKIEHMRFGPAELFLRHHRFFMWPDKHNTGAKQLRRMRAKQDYAVLTPERFRHNSVAVQGLSVLERLLFAKKPNLLKKDGEGLYLCQLSQAISRNLIQISTALHGDWKQGQGRHEIATAKGGNDSYESDIEVASILLNQLHTQLQRVVEMKLGRPLDKSIKRAKPKRAESWRSARALKNIKLNLISSQDLYHVGFSTAVLTHPSGDALNREITQSFKDAIERIASLKGPLPPMVKDPEQRAQLMAFQQHVSELQQLIGEKLPGMIHVPLGFNSLDGD
ncbi:imelysin family protein [Magnetococcus sp. PR-3]|uniref:imelysin family protein n=1 Tax=Magnetococcus sp. PR-3 TaxID=3120355 RepID=UPI002FCE4A5C